MPAADADAWAVVVPVRPLASAKSRLGTYGDALRQELALAFAEDVVTALARCPAVARVLVVTDDARVERALTALGAAVAPDVPGAGLNAAVAHGAEVLRRTSGSHGIACVPADLPCLRPEDVGSALAAVPPGGRAFVADADRRGTTLLAAAVGAELAPAYGVGSRARHRASGATELPAAPGLRRDVDTPRALQLAQGIGLGPRTAAVVARLA